MIVAGIHHLVLDQNLRVLKHNLMPDEVIKRMLKEISMEQFDLLTDRQEERIQRFIECLQQSSVENYKYFMKLLYETKQEPLITKLVTSCKISCINTVNIMFEKIYFLGCTIILFSNVSTDAELHVNIIQEDSEQDKVCGISFLLDNMPSLCSYYI